MKKRKGWSIAFRKMAKNGDDALVLPDVFPEDLNVVSDGSLSLSDFSFAKSQKSLENYSRLFSDKVIKERRGA